MTEILTESFCERCGTRYTFEPVANRRKPLSAIGTLGRGIRHFVSDPGTSLDEAFAVARSESEQRTTATALEAFHRTFNFCLSCRQYTCSDCWNTVEGRCLSCAPVPGALPPETRVDIAVAVPLMDIAQAPAPLQADAAIDAAVAEAAALAEAEADAARATEAQAAADAAAMAEADARVAAQAAEAEAAEAAEAATRAAAEAAEAAEAKARADAQAAEAEARLAAEVEAKAVAEAAAHAAAEAAAEVEAREAAEAEATAIAAAMAEAEAAALAAMAEAEARAAAESAARALADAEARAAAEAAEAAASSLAFEPGLNLDDQIAAYERELASAPEPVVVETEPVAAEPEPVAASYEPIPTAIGQPVPSSAVDGPLSWPAREAAAASYEPNWPDLPVPQGSPGAHVGAGLPAAESAPPPAPARACPSCGLSLSASARFCRRCGTPQEVVGPN